MRLSVHLVHGVRKSISNPKGIFWSVELNPETNPICGKVCYLIQGVRKSKHILYSIF